MITIFLSLQKLTKMSSEFQESELENILIENKTNRTLKGEPTSNK